MQRFHRSIKAQRSILSFSKTPLESAINVAVPDGTLEAIDRLFDLVDQGVDHVARVLNRSKQTAERHQGRKLRRPPAPTPSRATARPSTTTALARKSRFYIVEAVTPSGVTEFVVTDGGNARTVCPSRAFAEQILHALEKTP